MLRAGFDDGSTTSQQVKSGILVEDDLVNRIVTERLTEPDCDSGFLLDGYPRTVPQALFLQDMLAKRHRSPLVIHLDVPRDVVLSRVSFRKQCPRCGRIYNQRFSAAKTPGRCDADGAELTRRDDDDEHVIVGRLDSYERMAAPLMAHYQSADYHRVDGDRPPGEISRDLERLIEAAGLRRHSNGTF
jgi:adenylate kinase